MEAAAEDEDAQQEDALALIRRHKYHCVQLEGLLRLLENEQVSHCLSRLLSGGAHGCRGSYHTCDISTEVPICCLDPMIQSVANAGALAPGCSGQLACQTSP